MADKTDTTVQQSLHEDVAMPEVNAASSCVMACRLEL